MIGTKDDGERETLLVVTEAQYENLVKLVKGLGEEVDWCRDQVVKANGQELDEGEEDCGELVGEAADCNVFENSSGTPEGSIPSMNEDVIVEE